VSETLLAGAPQGTPEPADNAKLGGLLAHADDSMVVAQRLSEWISNAPELEIDIALGNICLDHLGVARALYTLAGEIEGAGRDEDDFAMRRTEREYVNCLLVEQPNGDFAHTIVRQFFFDVYQSLVWPSLRVSGDGQLGGIAARAAKENAYHLEFSQGWLHRLADGTDESHRRAQTAVDELWRFTGELAQDFSPAWEERVVSTLEKFGLAIPDDPYQRAGGRKGFHSEHLGHLLAEMQWMDRAYPGLTW
jgi:ring-1,2-phenylacetyl-CoA epoxidase subunit PaaC